MFLDESNFTNDPDTTKVQILLIIPPVIPIVNLRLKMRNPFKKMALSYGAARVGSSLFGELRSAIFARLTQSSVTSLVIKVF